MNCEISAHWFRGLSPRSEMSNIKHEFYFSFCAMYYRKVDCNETSRRHSILLFSYLHAHIISLRLFSELVTIVGYRCDANDPVSDWIIGEKILISSFVCYIHLRVTILWKCSNPSLIPQLWVKYQGKIAPMSVIMSNPECDVWILRKFYCQMNRKKTSKRVSPEQLRKKVVVYPFIFSHLYILV